MRGIILGSVLALAAFPAVAQSSMIKSIETIASGSVDANSIVSLSCTTCDGPAEEVKPDYVVPELKPGTERLEFVKTDAGNKVVRIEAWQGGSPIRRVSYTQAPIIEREIAYREKTQKQEQMATLKKGMDEWAKSRLAAIAPQIDLDTKTAALTPDGTTVAASAESAETPAFDPATLELRLN